MYPNELSYQAYVDHKINQYCQEADTERLLRKSRVSKDNEQSPRQATRHPLLGRALQLLRQPSL
jgi:hypothetical protein